MLMANLALRSEDNALQLGICVPVSRLRCDECTKGILAVGVDEYERIPGREERLTSCVDTPERESIGDREVGKNAM